ncbi:MAG: hypothetical protein RO257_02835 [Candidatus Kapabacteria bacterium]|nr:hypothetical protein [Candidatus Kapabacteria bacterium]
MNKSDFENDNLSINDIIYLFVDGEANDTEKTTLFNAIAGNTSLQNELQDAIKMNKSAKAFSGISAPPAILTARIMSAAGITTGAAVTGLSGGMTTGFWSGIAGSSIFKVVASAILGAVVMLGIIKLMERNDYPVNVNKNNFSESKVTDNLPLNKNTQSINIAKDTVVKYIYINRQIIQDTDLAIKNQDLSESGRININENDKIKPVINNSEIPEYMIQFDADSELSKTNSIDNMYYDNQLKDFDTDKGLFSIELSGLQKLALFPEREEFNLQETMNNTSGTVFLNLNQNHSIGLSIGRETFPIWVADENGELGARNSITWYGISYRYDFGNISEFIPLSPYLQLTGAATQNGPFTKAAFGLGWQPDSRVTFYIGYEYSMMIQRYQGHNEYNSKTGLIYSVNVNF